MDFAVARATVLTVPPSTPTTCWICGKLVSPDDAGLDEFGVSVHEECQRPRLKNPPKIPPKPPESK